MRTEESDSSLGAHGALFATTHWSVVLAAGQQDWPRAAEALERLCRTYWHPLYVYVRRRGYSPEDAQDLTQQFFGQFLEKENFRRANPARGRFRSFLLKSLEHFLADDWRRAHCAKRGGWKFECPLDSASAEARCAAELAETSTPERSYEKRWALTLLDRVLEQMRQDYTRLGKGRLFESLQDFLWGPDVPPPYAALAKELQSTEGALRTAVHSLREQYRRRLRAEIAHTVSDPSEVEDELRHLIEAIRAGQ